MQRVALVPLQEFLELTGGASQSRFHSRPSMSDHHEASPVATFPHDAIARMRQLQQLTSRRDGGNQSAQNQIINDSRQNTTTATE
jgi:hypothetical protein